MRCARTVDTLVMTVDGSVRTGHGPTGSISNASPLTIAGKLHCNQVDAGCDYFAGDIDRVQIDG